MRGRPVFSTATALRFFGRPDRPIENYNVARLTPCFCGNCPLVQAIDGQRTERNLRLTAPRRQQETAWRSGGRRVTPCEYRGKSRKKSQPIGVGILANGGGGENRTPVRKSYTAGTTCLARSSGSRLAPAGRQADARPAASTDPPGQAARPGGEADVNDAAPLSGPSPSAS